MHSKSDAADVLDMQCMGIESVRVRKVFFFAEVAALIICSSTYRLDDGSEVYTGNQKPEGRMSASRA